MRSLVVAAIEHEILKAGGLELSIGAVVADQQVCRPPDIEVGNHFGCKLDASEKPISQTHVARSYSELVARLLAGVDKSKPGTA